MPYRRRHQGLTAADRREEDRLWYELVLFLGHLGGIILANLPLLAAGLNVAYGLLNRVLAIRTVVWGAHARIDKVSITHTIIIKYSSVKVVTVNSFASMLD